MVKSNCRGALLAVVIGAVFISCTPTEGLVTIPDAPHGLGGINEGKANFFPKVLTDDDLVRADYSTGSSLPDCSHACGPCFPCRRVIVSSTCSVSEPCPVVYRCMCRGKYYHVPSN